MPWDWDGIWAGALPPNKHMLSRMNVVLLLSGLGSAVTFLMGLDRAFPLSTKLLAKPPDAE